MRIIPILLLSLFLTACGTKTVLVMPKAPELLMSAPRGFQLPSDDIDLRKFSEIATSNNVTARQNSIQLESLQNWIREMNSIYPPK